MLVAALLSGAEGALRFLADFVDIPFGIFVLFSFGYTVAAFKLPKRSIQLWFSAGRIDRRSVAGGWRLPYKPQELKMKFVLAAAIVALTTLALPAVAKPCDENASEAMKRQGGYCDILNSNSSLSTPSGHTAAVDAADKSSGGDWQLPDDVKVPAI